jgi:polyhydroxyalkanoate synthesis repressor PhaR
VPTIKRYANRKLYDTEAKRYVTLEDLAESIRRGEDVHVVGHVTGEDLTSLTLFQVIFEEEKKIGGLLPQVFLSRLIRAGGDTVSTLRSRLVSLDPFQMVDEEIRRRVQTAVKQARLSEEEAQHILDLLIRKTPQADVVHIPVRGEDEEIPLPEEGQPPAEPLEPETAPEELNVLVSQVQELEQEVLRLKKARGIA